MSMSGAASEIGAAGLPPLSERLRSLSAMLVWLGVFFAIAGFFALLLLFNKEGRGLEERTFSLEAEKSRTLAAIEVLRIEQAHLARPGRIGGLAARRLGAVPVPANSIVSLERFVAAEVPVFEAVEPGPAGAPLEKKTARVAGALLETPLEGRALP